jgi:XTP/dITP diphosphohydrolase
VTPASRDILIATHNEGKMDEFRALLAPRDIIVTSAAEHGLPVPDETEATFAGNALIKARAAARGSGLTALADDSGLSVDAIDGAPGVHTADWAETDGGRDFAIAMERLHLALKKSGQREPWIAKFTCVLALVTPDLTERTFEGVVRGRIVLPMRGRAGHGFDPVFQPEGSSQTFAEMDATAKNAISHRAKAIEGFLAWLDRP